MQIKNALLLFLLIFNLLCAAQHKEISEIANNFLLSLTSKQKEKTIYSFTSEERYNWHFIPKNDRKGISLNELNQKQKQAAMLLLRTAMSEHGYKQATAIIQLEEVLRSLENRPANDRRRDTGNYYFTIFNTPSPKGIWGWRLEGHHLSLNFSSQANQLISGTPAFFGANPARVLSGPQKGTQILKKEEDLAFALLQTFATDQIKKAINSTTTPGDIITSVSRKAMIENEQGLSFFEMTKTQQDIFIELLSVYIHRYTKSFADVMMKEIEAAGMNKLLFAWAGSTKKGSGNPNYYRIQGPTIIIEYDNTQNNANHVHTVIRDLKNDFGGDKLLEHYKKNHR
jgi:hypothetical protein